MPQRRTDELMPINADTLVLDFHAEKPDKTAITYEAFSTLLLNDLRIKL